jgi:hypothetical protein
MTTVSVADKDAPGACVSPYAEAVRRLAAALPRAGPGGFSLATAPDGKI